MLISHLKSDDFFAVDRFPTASLILTGWEPDAIIYSEAPSGIATGELTIKDVSRPVRFQAIAASQRDGSLRIHAAYRFGWSRLPLHQLEYPSYMK